VDTSRISFGEMVAAASGLALFIFMFLPWFGAEIDVAGFSQSDSASAWEALSFIDILLFLVVLVAVGVAVARAAGAMPSDLPAPPGTIVMGAGLLALVLILFRIIDLPTPDVAGLGEDTVEFSRKIGIFLAFIAAAGIAFGGYTAANERSGGAAPAAGTRGGTTPPSSTPPASTPPPSTPPSSTPPGQTPPSDPPPA
jgi:hypothetical protein